MEAKIEIVLREFIKPSSPTPHQLREHKLSFIDQYLPHLFIPFIFLYQNSDTNYVHPSKTSKTLKQSLSETLTKFYPLAGKLLINADDFYVVDCDDSGALFVEAKVDAPLRQAALEDEKTVQYLPFDPFSGDELILGLYPRNETLLGVQITCFESGGISVGVCISHRVADFASFMAFLNSWAAANLAGDRKSPVIEPNFDSGRDLFPPVRVKQDRRPQIFDGFSSAKNDQKTEQLTLKRFVIDKEKINQLKDIASSQTVKGPTRVEVITAYLWKEFIKIAPKETHLRFRVGHMVNLRSRISSLSSLDQFAFGNLAVFTASDPFSKNDGVDFGELVHLIRSAIRETNLVLNDEDTVKTPEEIIHSQFSSYCKYPIYEVDFGWGKPVSAGPPCTLNLPSVTLMDTRDGEGIEAWIHMFEDEFDLLPEDLLSVQATHLFQINS